MASEKRHTSDPVTTDLSPLDRDATRFDFFQALRLIETSEPRKPAIGYARRVAEDVFRSGQDPDLRFPPSTLSAFRRGAQGKSHHVRTRFFGLFGPVGPMPLYLTEYALERRRKGDETLTAFADLLQHRMLSFYYRAWSDTEATVTIGRKDADGFADFLHCLAGRGTENLNDRDAMPDALKLYFTAFLASLPKTVQGLTSMVELALGVPVALEEFVGEWMVLPKESRTRLGGRSGCALGDGLVVGGRIWSRGHKIRLLLGPLTWVTYQSLFPGRPLFERLQAVVRNYLGDEMAWDVALLLRADEVPDLQMGQVGMLGWSTWLGERRTARPADDLKLAGSVPLSCC